MSFCAYYDTEQCRSCAWIDLSYADQLKNKTAQLHELLDPFEPHEWLKPSPSSVKGFRNKAKMVASAGSEGVTLGLSEETSLIGCPLYPEPMQRALEVIQQWLRELGIKPYEVKKKKGELKYVLLTRSTFEGSMMLRFVLRSHGVIPRLQKGLDELLQSLPELKVVTVNIQPVHMAILEGEEEIYLTETKRIEERFNGIPLYIRPKSFFQTNPEIAAKLYKTASEWAGNPSVVWDLFCGTGGFALHCMKEGRKVIGIEIEPEAIECARDSAEAMGIEGLTFRALDAASFRIEAEGRPDVLIVNPPRRGLGEQLCKWISKVAPETIVYSSCNAQTLARDLEMLDEYRIGKVQLFDMFPHTGHYEVLCLLEKSPLS